MQTLFTDIQKIYTLEKAAQQQARKVDDSSLSPMSNAAILVENGRIVWIGPQKKIPKKLIKSKCKKVSLKKQIVLPGFVECHTHSVFAGNRANEFSQRLAGVSYLEIAKQGGGILSTVKQTRQATLNELMKSTRIHVQDFLRQGVTTLEIKSGYALNLKDELKMLSVIQKLSSDKKLPQLVPTFLGAHALAPEYTDYDSYLKFLLTDVLPKVKQKKLCQRVDIFIEKGFFEKSSGLQFLKQAKQMGFQIVVHADQLTLSGGTEVALELEALSADHVIQINDQVIDQVAKSNLTTVLLPAADFYMRCAYPPARKLIDAGARVAIATDFNPGSSPTRDLSFTGLLARMQMQMTLPEVIVAYTLGASNALGMQNQIGSLEPGKHANFICIDGDVESLFYQVGKTPVSRVFREGIEILSAQTNAARCKM